jgi:hypothetical protein
MPRDIFDSNGNSVGWLNEEGMFIPNPGFQNFTGDVYESRKHIGNIMPTGYKPLKDSTDPIGDLVANVGCGFVLLLIGFYAFFLLLALREYEKKRYDKMVLYLVLLIPLTIMPIACLQDLGFLVFYSWTLTLFISTAYSFWYWLKNPGRWHPFFTVIGMWAIYFMFCLFLLAWVFLIKPQLSW